MIRKAEHSRVVLPMTVPISLLRVRKIKLMLSRDYQVCIMKSHYNLYEQVHMANKLDEVIRDQSRENDDQGLNHPLH